MPLCTGSDDSGHTGVATLAAGLPSGAYLAWLDQVCPMFSKVTLKPEAVIGIVGSTNHRFRVLTVFRKA
jgi:hypothetical protein